MDNDNGLNELKALLLLNCYLMLAGDEFPARQDENAIWEAVAKNYDKIRLWLKQMERCPVPLIRVNWILFFIENIFYFDIGQNFSRQQTPAINSLVLSRK
ncbi:MAG: hypothetical protein JRJ02_07445 [Deltaproteobacteria bacterium]|nr:hypothetical protein [Deltaproteobacteria bacterium]